MSIAITEAITTLAEADRRFGLVRSEDDTLFPEWQTDLPELSEEDRSALDVLDSICINDRKGNFWKGG